MFCETDHRLLQLSGWQFFWPWLGAEFLQRLWNIIQLSAKIDVKFFKIEAQFHLLAANPSRPMALLRNERDFPERKI